MMIVRKIDLDTFWIGGCFEYERNVYVNAINMEAGEYFILIEVVWC